MITEEELYNMYWINRMSHPEIAKEIGVSCSTIDRLAKAYGTEIRTNSEAQLNVSQLNGISVLSEEELRDMYWVQKMSQPEIAKYIGVSQATIGNWMKSYGIGIRTVSEAALNCNLTGENNGRWQGGISFEPYCHRFNNSFKEYVRVRDDYTCQLCRCEQEQNGRKLDVHHIHYDKKNCYPDVVALCHPCNISVNSNRDYWEEYFENQLLERGLYCWSL